LRARLTRAHQRPAVRALLGTLVGSIPGFLVPFAVAGHFGIGRDTDAYVYALAVATFGLTLAFAVLEANVLPVAQFWAARGRQEFLRFAQRTAMQAFAVVGVVELPVAGIGLTVLAARSSWSVSERNVSATAILILLALVAVCGITGVLAGCLYSLNDFVTPTVSQSLRSLLPLAGLLVIGRNGEAVEQLAGLVVAGEALRAVILWATVRVRAKTLVPRPSEHEPMKVWRAAGPAALGTVVIALNPIVDRSVAARFGPGSVTVLDLGEKIFYVPFTVVQASVVLVAGARWARSLLGDRDVLQSDFVRSLKLTFVLSVFLSASAIVLLYTASGLVGPSVAGVPLTEIRGVTVYFLVGLPGATIWILCGRFLTVSQQTHLLPPFAVLGLVVNVVGDVVGSLFLQVDGVALGSSVVSYAMAALGVLTCRILLKHDFPRNPWRLLPWG
jgi:peptidoglycan biosynthesis protein MviN/MurJ (putative lipid II flippase)